MSPRTASTFLKLIEWGSLVCATILLVLREIYHPWVNISVGLLGICWVARRIHSGAFTRSTLIDLPIVLFVISTFVAYWVAPNRPAALVRLYLILTAVSFYYYLVNSNIKSLKIFSSVLTVSAGFIGIFLISQYDWAQIATRFQLTKETGIWLNRLIPNLQFSLPHWNATRNILASLLAVSLPVVLLDIFSGTKLDKPLEKYSGNSKRNLLLVKNWLAILGFVLITFSLVLTESRTPWIVFGVIFSSGIWWWVSGRLKIKLPLSRSNLFLLGLGVAFLLAGLVIIRQSLLFSLLSRIPGPSDYLSRGDLYPQSWRLAQDTPFTGGGLAAYPALYSTYIRVIPFNAFLNEDTGNNAYLNLLVEQGWLGLLSYIVLLLVAFRAAIGRLDQMKPGARNTVIAGILGTAFILVHGFVHATLVATRALPMLLIPAGLALSGIEGRSVNQDLDGGECRFRVRHPFQLTKSWRLASVLVVLILSSTLLFIFRADLLSAWYADIGVVKMSQRELSDFPSGKWDDGSQVWGLSPSEKLFQKALVYTPNNRTAHHRLGLIAMMHRDFPTAIAHLEKANQLDPFHRGIRKTLGYSYVWDGQPERAIPLLVEIPEARSELKVYISWWERQGREDLAAMSERIIVDLNSGRGQ